MIKGSACTLDELLEHIFGTGFSGVFLDGLELRGSSFVLLRGSFFELVTSMVKPMSSTVC